MLQRQEDMLEMAHIQGQLSLIDMICNMTPCNIEPALEFILKGWEKKKKEELEILNKRNRN